MKMVRAKVGKFASLVKCVGYKGWIRNTKSCSQQSLEKRHFSVASPASGSNIIGPDFIVSSPFPNFEVVSGLTIPEFVWQNLPITENAPAFECADTGKKLTHGDVYRQSRSFAAALIQAGIKPRDVLNIVLPNIPDYAIVLFGIWEAGAIASTINPVYSEEEISRQMTMSGAKIVVTTSNLFAKIKSALKVCPQLKSVIVIGPAQEGAHTFSEMVKVNVSSRCGAEFLKGSKIDTKEEVAVLPFSSGTTGPRKVRSPVIKTPKRQNYGMTALILANTYLGTNVLCIPKFKPNTFVKHIKYFRPTILTLVTPIISFIANSPDLTAKDFTSVRCIQAGAAPVGTALIHKVLEKAEKYLFFQEMYGLTELSPASHVMNPSKGNSKIGSCGTLVPGTLGKIIDYNTGKSLGPRVEGEICVKGPQVMKGYFKNKEATKNCIDPEGWFHTGDIAYYDEEGCFYIVDRLKELIKVQGLQVAPAELEDELRKNPEVVDVAVIGVPHQKYGEAPRAYIVRKSETLTESKIHEFLSGKVAKYKELKGGVEFVSSIPKATSGKILRRELKADYISKLKDK